MVEAEILLSGQTEENKNDRCKINLLPIHSNDLTIRFENPGKKQNNKLLVHQVLHVRKKHTAITLSSKCLFMTSKPNKI